MVVTIILLLTFHKVIHHISAIVGNPTENIKFYRDVLQLKLIKKTVNYDDPSTYHLYFSIRVHYDLLNVVPKHHSYLEEF